MEIEQRYIPCPECGDERGTNPSCALCKQYNPSLTRVRNIKRGENRAAANPASQPPRHGPGSEEWENLKRKYGPDQKTA